MNDSSTPSMNAPTKRQHESDSESSDEELRLARANVSRLEEISRKKKTQRKLRKADERVEELERALQTAREEAKKLRDELGPSASPVAQQNQPYMTGNIQRRVLYDI